MERTKGERGFVSLDALATILGVPRAWLKREADSGAIPYLQVKAGRLFPVGEVRAVLIGRAKRETVATPPTNDVKLAGDVPA